MGGGEFRYPSLLPTGLPFGVVRVTSTRLFDLENRRALRIIEKPLLLMEGTITDELHLAHSDAALDMMMRLKETCRRFNGTFTLLWHNSHFLRELARRIFTALWD